MTFWISWTIDLVVALILLWFFMVGISDGSVSSRNAGLWALLLCVVLGVVAGSYALRSTSHGTLAIVLAMILAVPAALFGLGLLATLILPGRWN